MIKMKMCANKNCQKSEPQPTTFFRKDKGKKDGLSSYCKQCSTAICKIYRKNNKDKDRINSNKWNAANSDRRRGYALKQYWPNSTWQEAIIKYNELKNKQNNLCAICQRPEREVDKRKNKLKDLSVDHNHVTGKVRGLLCQKCNYGIGLLEVDDGIDFLIKAINYCG